MSEGAPPRSKPLAGLRILDLTRLLPGPVATQHLADLGADVVKIEDTGEGDYARTMGARAGETSAFFKLVNRNKRGLRLDLKQPGGIAVFRRLTFSADVVIEGFRPGVMDKLGIGYAALAEINPRLVFCSISGYGQDGPYAQRAGHDINYLALNGMLGLTGTRGGPPVSAAGQIADLGGGALMAAFGTLAALHHARRTGEGQAVDVAMADGSLAWLAMVAGRYFCDGEVPERGNQQLSGALVCYLSYEASDGWVACGALEPKFWGAFCHGVGRPDLVEGQFESPGSAAWEEVAAIFRARTRAEWAAFNDEHDCCIEPVLDLDEALDSELTRAREMVVELEQPRLGKVRQLGVPVKLSHTPGDPTRPAPAFGEHTAEALREVGYSEAEIAALLESGAAAGGEAGGPAAEFRA